jgi:hypothetical protein
MDDATVIVNTNRKKSWEDVPYDILPYIFFLVFSSIFDLVCILLFKAE